MGAPFGLEAPFSGAAGASKIEISAKDYSDVIKAILVNRSFQLIGADVIRTGYPFCIQ